MYFRDAVFIPEYHKITWSQLLTGTWYWCVVVPETGIVPDLLKHQTGQGRSNCINFSTQKYMKQNSMKSCQRDDQTEQGYT